MVQNHTPGGYSYEDPIVEGQPDTSIRIPYAEAYDILLDGLECAASLEPITESTFKALAEDLLNLLIDASDDIVLQSIEEHEDFEDADEGSGV